VLAGNADKKDTLKQAEIIASKVRGLSIHHPRSSVDRFVTVSFAVASGVPSAEFTAAELLEEATKQLTNQSDSSDISLGSAGSTLV
jgi:PleD family two-component response regulator